MAFLYKLGLWSLLLLIVSTCDLYERKTMIMYGIDSLTDGAGGNSFREEFKKINTTSKDIIEIGFIHLNHTTSKSENIGFYKSSGLKEIANSNDFSIAPMRYSISGKGIYGIDLKNEGFSYDTKSRSFDNLRLYYLQEPNAGNFSYRLGNQQKNEVINMSGPLDIKWVDIKNINPDNRLVIVNKINGNATFFGIHYFTNGANKSYCNLAKGGMKLDKIIQLDSKFRKKWFEILKPHSLILNAGTNDRIDSDKKKFKQQLEHYRSKTK